MKHTKPENLDALIRDLGISRRQGAGDVQITDLTDDSRAATPGCLFVARQGEGWRDYVAQGVERGAVAVVAAEAIEVPEGVALLLAERVDQALAGRIAARFFGEPAKQLKLLGVTGTNGKTTVATLIQHLLNAHQTKCAFIGTTAIDTGHSDGPRPAELTTPGAIDLQRLFAEMVAQGRTACAMEVSSHALDQGRVDGLDFAVAVFTNLTQDHLDYHGTMENYAATKAKLFGSLSREATAVINVDVSYGYEHVMSEATEARLRWTSTKLNPANSYGSPGSPAVAQPIELAASYSTARFVGEWGSVEARLPVVGDHNLSNVLQAISAADAVCSMRQGLRAALESLPVVPGRLEPVKAEAADAPAVLVDYAHTPDALMNVLAALRPLTSGRLITVFGCGGDRDRTKRPLMAKAAAELSDVAYLTSDNPRTEDPQQILDDTLAGMPGALIERVTSEIDRAAAIRAAVMSASPNDTVLIAGKGHEDYQILGTEKIHFDDREHAAAALKAWVAAHPSGSPA